MNLSRSRLKACLCQNVALRSENCLLKGVPSPGQSVAKTAALPAIAGLLPTLKPGVFSDADTSIRVSVPYPVLTMTQAKASATHNIARRGSRTDLTTVALQDGPGLQWWGPRFRKGYFAAQKVHTFSFIVRNITPKSVVCIHSATKARPW